MILLHVVSNFGQPKGEEIRVSDLEKKASEEKLKIWTG